MNSAPAPENTSSAVSGNASGASGTWVSEIMPMIKDPPPSLLQRHAGVFFPDDDA